MRPPHAYQSGLIDIDVLVIHRTERAILINDGDREVWIPLAHVEVGPISPDRHAVLTLPEWLAKEKGLV